MDDIKINGMTADEWEELANPQQPTNDDLVGLGVIEQVNSQDTAETNNNKPELAERQDYEDLGYWQTVGDELTAGAVEASKFFIPKKYELNYTPRTRAGEAFQTFSKYLYGFGGLLIGGEVAGIAKGALAAKNMTGLAKAAGGTEAILKGNKFFKTSQAGAKAFGVDALNIGTQGVLQGAILDATIHDENEGRLADMFGETNNAFVDWLQTDINDSKATAKLKNVIDGALFSIGINGVVSAASPILGRLFKNVKLAKNTKEADKEISEATAQEIAQDYAKLERIAETSDLVDTVKTLREECKETGEDVSQRLIDTLHPENIEDGQAILKMLDDGENIFVHNDGTFDIAINNWEDAYKVSEEEYTKQLKAQDEMTAEFGEEVRYGDSALQHQDEAVKQTWTNRGWIGENEELTQPNANKIAKNYKDKFQIDNNIKVEFVDGLTINGKAVEGNTSQTSFLGKNKKPTKAQQTKIDKKKLEIQQLQDKITQLEGGNGGVSDPLDILKEKLRIANNELKNLTNIPHPQKLGNITIQIDKNARNPYATLRAELEHARDLAKGEIPKEEGKHFARYNGANEGEVASGYTYKKSLGKKQKTSEISFTDGKSPEWESERLTLKDGIGNPIINLDYNVSGDTLELIDINNISYGESYYFPKQGAKAVDELIKRNPNIKEIKWDAVTKKGMKFKEDYLKQHPELKKKVKGISTKKELDTHINNDYNTSEGVLNETSNKVQELEGSGTKVSRDSSSNDIRSNGQEILQTTQSNNMENVVAGNSSRANARGKNTSNNYEQLKIDFSQAKTPGEIVDTVTSGKAKINEPQDVSAMVNKSIELDPEISGTTWEAIAKDSDKLADLMVEADSLGYTKDLQEALSMNDVKAMDGITRKVLAAQKLSSHLGEKLATLGDNPPYEAMSSVIDLIDQIKRYTKDTGSASGRNLQARKLINKGVQTFGSLRLSELTKAGISLLSDLLEAEINKLDLNFTRGSLVEKKQALIDALLTYEDSPFVKLLAEDEKIAAKFDEILDNLFKEGNTTSDNIYTKLERAITEERYREVYNVTKLTDNPKVKSNVVRNWVDKQGGLTSYYVHNLLSGVGTLAKNVISGGLNTVYFPAKKIVAGMLGGGTELSKEGWNTYKNMLSNWAESWNLMKAAFLNGDGKLSMMRDTMNLADDEVFDGFREWNFNDTTPEGMWHSIQNIHSFMTRAMGASDEFMSQLNYRSIVRARAMNNADKLAAKFNITDEAIKNKIADNLFNKAFDSNGKPLDVKAFAEAKDILYQLPLDGKIFDNASGEMVQIRETSTATTLARGLNSAASKSPFLKVIFPFVKTGANILQQNLEHNGLYALCSTNQRQLLMSNTREGALARSQVAFGCFSFGFGALMAMSGKITGSAPSDPKERKALFETGWKPYSVVIGDKYVSYQGYEPIQTILGFAADSVNIYGNIVNSKDEEKWSKFTQQVMSTAVNNFLDKAAFRTGLRQMACLVSPDEDNAEKAIQALAQTAQGFLPNVAFVKNTSSIGKRDVTAPQTPYERMFNNYFNRGLGDYRRDVFGYRQDNVGLLATNLSKNNSDTPEYRELERLAQYGFNPSEISKVIKDTTLKYKDFKDPNTGRSIYDSMQEELSTVEIEGKTLQDAVRELVESDEYQELPDGVNMNGVKYSQSDVTKINELRALFVEYNNKALNNVINDYGDMYVDNKNRTMSEAVEEVQLEKMNQSIQQSLDDNISDQILNFGQ